ncbi:MAG: hypothetical protein QMC83_02635 [Thermodesulfovibrionales bacterium]|nr:hypothetical protein [Thermodesulfovibrionales bacterium]
MQGAIMKGSKTILLTFIFLGVIGSFSDAYAIQLGTAELEIEPYLRGGTIAWDQLGGIGGHKSLIAGGLNTNVKFNSFGSGISLEKWWVAEGLDDDKGIIPREGYSIYGDIKYYFKTNGILFYPYAGVGFEEWEKGETWQT